nr:MAG TPA: hypothetical protein [Siphoviridae sp. ctcOR4]DAO91820.1 MAG TPA: hypothetical protein [Caudoviricetes sp.]
MLRFDLIVETEREDTIRAAVNAILNLNNEIWQDPTFRASATIPDKNGDPTYRQLAGNPEEDTYQATYTTHSDGWTSFGDVEDAA